MSRPPATAAFGCWWAPLPHHVLLVGWGKRAGQPSEGGPVVWPYTVSPLSWAPPLVSGMWEPAVLHRYSGRGPPPSLSPLGVDSPPSPDLSCPGFRSGMLGSLSTSPGLCPRGDTEGRPDVPGPPVVVDHLLLSIRALPGVGPGRMAMTDRHRPGHNVFSAAAAGCHY